MEQKDIMLIAVAVVICVIICVLSPYIASGDPDGLEKSAEDSGLAEDFSIEEINEFLMQSSRIMHLQIIQIANRYKS